MFDQINLKNIIIGVLLLIILSKVYKKLKSSDEERDNNYYNQVIKQYLFDENLGIDERPCLWIHLHNDSDTIPEVNSRYWPSFGSRNTLLINMPYQFLTIKSIIEKNKADFNILIINDESFEKLIPNWNINLYEIPIPIRPRIRQMALGQLLFLHGGLIVPSSFICEKSLNPIYQLFTIDNKMFVGSFRNNISSAQITENSIPQTLLWGCRPRCPILREFLNYCETNQSNDFTAESDFKGVISIWLKNKIQNDLVNEIDGRLLGTLKNNKKEVWVEELLGSSYVDLYEDRLGTYIPWDDILNRSIYGWFSRMDPYQVLESDTFIGKLLLTNN
jgi:hypothetical protein